MMKKLLLFFLCLQANVIIQAQCTPGPSDTCKGANVLCSLDEVNGYSCHNQDYSNPTGCTPLCPSGGDAHNTSWWAFVTNGGSVCITFYFSNCTVNETGVQFGIWGDCNCSESIFCDPNCTGPGVKIACGLLKACKTYYFFVDGCTGDVCDFTFMTSGGAPPQLPPLGNIMGPITLCRGACNVEYMTTVGGSGNECEAAFQWTLDGNELDQYSDKIKLDFPDEGDFVLCVTAIIGNIISGSICDQEGPKCMNIKVRQEKDRTDKRLVCFENTPIVWHGQQIDASGEYIQHFTNKNCCEYDSVVTFTVIAQPQPGIVYFLGCPGDNYKDPTTGRTFGNCQDPVNIMLSKSTEPYRCDSTYDLYVAILNATGRVREYCQGGMIICEVMPIDKTCNVNGYSTEGFEYKWYSKSDPTNKTIGTNEFIEVPIKDDYCVDITVTGRLDKLSKKCTFTVCELFNEDEFKYQQICPKGSLEICVGDTTSFSAEGSFPSDARHIWTVGGGVIVTQNPISNKTIEVLWNFDPSPNNSYDGIICYHMESSCPETPECCINIKVHYNQGTVNAGPDEQVRGLKNTLKAEPNYSGTWTMVKGPGIATFKNANDSKSSVQVNRFGIYTFKWTISCSSNYSDEVNITFLRVRIIGGTGKQGRDSCCVDPGNFSELSERSTLRSYSIVPNPIQEKHFKIQGGKLESTSDIMIIDLQGKKIFEKNLIWNTSTQEIELGQDIRSGIYYLRIQDEDGNYWADKLLIIH